MKKLFNIITCTFLISGAFAQSVGIGTSTPNVNALLDISSSTKGLLIPRMNQAQRDAMVNPPSGMLLYMNGTNDVLNNPIGFYCRTSGAWVHILSNADIDKTWEKITDGQYSLSSKVGIGIEAPLAPLHIRQAGASPTMRIDGGSPSIYFSVGNEQDGYSNTGRIYGRGNDLVIGGALGSSEKRIVFQLSGADKVLFEPDGTFKTKAEIRLTDDAFVAKGFMQLSGNDVRIGTVSANNTGNFVIRTNGNDAVQVNPSGDLIPAGTLQFKEGTLEKSFVQRSGNNLRLGTNIGNVDGDVIVRMNGNDRFKFEPSGRMTISGDVNPTLYFSAGGVNKAYMQVQGNDLQIRAINNKVELGDFVTVDDALNRVGISTTTPDQKLHVQGGSAKISTGKVYNNSDENLMPLGYAVFASNGTKVSGTANLSGGWIGTDFYLSCANEDINSTAVFITCRNARLFPSYVNETLGRVRINFYDEDTDTFQAGFSVVVYKTN